jgi:hypothetical protein
MTSFRNLCRSCEADFSSVSAFERHRVGAHDLDYPEHETGRRCMDEEEMLEAGMERDQRGRWRTALREGDRERLAQLREAA